MTSATIDQPPATSELPLTSHFFNARGECWEPERIVVRMPKGCACELRLALDYEGSWRVGYKLAADKEGGIETNPRTDDPGYTDRALALAAAIKAASDFFAASPKSKAHRKCATELAAYVQGLKGSPANKPGGAKDRLPFIPDPVQCEVAVARLEANPFNPRGEIDLKAEDIAALAETIAEVGLLQPVGVRRLPYDDSLPGVAGDSRLQLLWGHRRTAAFRKLGRETIPARVYENLSDEQARLLLLIENGQQKQLDPIQEARGYQEMARDFDLTQDDIAKAVKKSRPVIANALRLLELPAGVQTMLQEGQLTLAHGTALCRFTEWPEVCVEIGNLAAKNKVSANSLEKNLPFSDELAKAGLAIDLSHVVHTHEKQWKKLAAEHGFFLWEDKRYYDHYAFTLDLVHGKELVAEHERKRAAEREKYEVERTGRDESGELTPAAKRERQKKIDTNLTNRLQTAATMHAAVERVRVAKGLDLSCVYIVAYEAFRHLGGYGCEIDEEIAKELGVKLPKGFDSSNISDIRKLDAHDLLRMAAAGLARREANDAMRNAFVVPEFVEQLAMESGDKNVEFDGYVEEWRKVITPHVHAGKKADAIQAELGCPEFIAVQLTRTIKRELREAKAAPEKLKVEVASKTKSAKKGGKKK